MIENELTDSPLQDFRSSKKKTEGAIFLLKSEKQKHHFITRLILVTKPFGNKFDCYHAHFGCGNINSTVINAIQKQFECVNVGMQVTAEYSNFLYLAET